MAQEGAKSTTEKMHIKSIKLLLITLLRYADARSWKDVVDPSIFLASAIDGARLETVLEKDPFHPYGTPTMTPTITKVTEAQSNPSAVPVIHSTQAPTARYEMIVGNGGCPVGKNLFEIRMEDSWGDGWDGTQMRIVAFSVNATDSTTSGSSHKIVTNQDLQTVTVSQSVQVKSDVSPIEVFRGQLEYGEEAYDYVCLETSKCYRVTVNGGEWEEEIKWDIRRVVLGESREERENGLALAKGLAPTSCQFSVPDSTSGAQVCLSTCGDPTKSKAPTQAPTFFPSLLPTHEVQQSTEKTVAPSVNDVSDAPSLFPTAFHL
jgi:hypothetical protein